MSGRQHGRNTAAPTLHAPPPAGTPGDTPSDGSATGGPHTSIDQAHNARNASSGSKGVSTGSSSRWLGVSGWHHSNSQARDRRLTVVVVMLHLKLTLSQALAHQAPQQVVGLGDIHAGNPEPHQDPLPAEALGGNPTCRASSHVRLRWGQLKEPGSNIRVQHAPCCMQHHTRSEGLNSTESPPSAPAQGTAG
jgi:hypothetical protein